MTEYDYSPEAYERYLDTQHRISRWVDNTEAHSHEFKVPFGPRSDVDPNDLDGRSEAGAAIPRGGSAGGYYSARRGYGDHERDYPYRSAGHGPTGLAGAPPTRQPPFHAPVPVHATGPYIRSPAPAPTMGAYPPPPQLMSPPVSPPQPIVIQTYPKHHHSSHHHSHHDSRRSDSRSHKSKSKTRTYIIQPTPSVPMQSYPYPVSAAPPYAGYPYANKPSGVTSPTSYPAGYYSPPLSGSPALSPHGTIGAGNASYFPQQTANAPSYVIIPPKGRNLRVLYA